MGDQTYWSLDPHSNTVFDLQHLHKYRIYILVFTGMKISQMGTQCRGDLHNIGHYCTARDDNHDGCLNLVIRVQQTLTCQVHQHTSHHPDAKDRQQGTKDLQGFKCAKTVTSKKNPCFTYSPYKSHNTLHLSPRKRNFKPAYSVIHKAKVWMDLKTK